MVKTLALRLSAGLAAVALLAFGSSAALAAGEHGQGSCCGGCSQKDAHQTHQETKAAQPAGDPYLLASDPVTGQALGNHPVMLVFEGRELRFANQQNADKFKADPKAYLSRVDQQLIQQQLAVYPLTTCVVSDEKLGDMGEPVNFIHNNRLVRICCEGCRDAFKADPAKYIKKLDAAAIAAQKAKYPQQVCVVSGEKLGSMGDPVDYVAGNRLVRFCCAGCTDPFKANPNQYLQKLGAASEAQMGRGHRSGQGHSGHGAHGQH